MSHPRPASIPSTANYRPAMIAPKAYHAQILADCAAIEATVDASGLTGKVAYCDGWSTGDVIRHLGGVHRWALRIARTSQPATFPSVDVGDDELTAWLTTGVAELCDALSSGDPHDECWTFGFPPEQLWFWSRRQALETAVHRIDIELSHGPAAPIPSWLAADGIDEVVTSLFPRQIALERSPNLSGQVLLAPTDTETTFSVGISGGSTAELHGPTQDLLLRLWKRPYGHLESSGDASLLADFDAVALTP